MRDLNYYEKLFELKTQLPQQETRELLALAKKYRADSNYWNACYYHSEDVGMNGKNAKTFEEWLDRIEAKPY